MRRCDRFQKLIAAFTVGLILVGSRGMCQFFVPKMQSTSYPVDEMQTASIDWNGEYYYAIGDGTVPSDSEESNRTKAAQKARNYGKMKAIANLMTAIESTPISYKAIGKDYIGRDLMLQRTVEEQAANVEIVAEKQHVEGSDTVITVTVRVPMYGPGSVGEAILRYKFQHELLAARPQPEVTVDKLSENKSTASGSGSITSLIVDCTGINIDRAMHPKLRKADGSRMWISLSANTDFLQDHGVVAYARKTDDAKRSARAGSSPLIVKAMGRAGVRTMCDAVVSDADAARITQENSSAHFLDKCDVIFVVDKE